MRRRALEAFMVYVVFSIANFLVRRLGHLEIETLQEMLVSGIPIHVFFVGVSVVWTRKVWQEDLSVLGWTRLGWKRNLFVGFLVFLASTAVTVLFSMVVSHLGVDLAQRRFPSPDMQTFIMLVFSVLVLAPIAEETFFRGFLQAKLTQAASPPLGIVITSALFSMGHMVWGLPQVFLTFIVALIWGYAFHRTKSILTPTIAHGLSNFLGIILAAITL